MSIIIQIDDQKLDVTTLSTARILELYNQLAFELGKPEVKRFATRSKAEGRLIGIADEARQKGKAKSKNNETLVNDSGTKLVSDGPNSFKLELSESDQKLVEKAKEEAAPASSPAPTPAPAAVAATGAPRWARAKKEPAAKIAYKPRPSSSQARMYELLTQPNGIDINEFCETMVKEGIKDKTLHTPSSVWSCLRYLFVTSKGYGLRFDGTCIQLLVPNDEREANGHNKKA